MNINETIDGILESREELRSSSALTEPVVLSESMYKLAQYVSAAEEIVANIEADLIITEANKTKEYSLNNWSTTKVNQKVKLESAEMRSTMVKLNRLIDSSWRLINVAQSRRNHITEELRSQL